MDILSNYDVKFLNKIIHNGLVKTLSTNNEYLTGLIGSHRYVSEAQDILNAIEETLSGQIEVAEGPVKGYSYVKIEPSVTKLYKDFGEWGDNPNRTPDYTLPTSHLKIIFEAWLDFLKGKES